MDLLISLAVGALVGFLASVLMKARMGLLACLIVGILGSLLGHWASGLIGIAATGTIGRLLISMGGAMAFIALLRASGLAR